MAWDGSGNFVRNTGVFTGPTAWQQTRDANREIRADDADTHDQDIALGLQNTLTRDGQTAPTSDLPMAGRKHTNVAEAAALNQYAAGSQVQNYAFSWCGTAGGTADAIALSPSFAIAGYVAGQEFDFIAATTNTGPVTVNVSNRGARNLTILDGQALQAGDILAGATIKIKFDGTNFQVLTQVPVETSPTTTEGDMIVRDATKDERLPLGDGFSLLGSDKTTVAYFGGSTVKTANYTVLASDHRKTILCDSSGGAFTVTLPSLASVGDGFYVKVKKVGTGTNAVTVATAGSETIDDDSARILRGRNQLEEYTCDGSNWYITSDLAGLVLLDEKTASGTSNIDFIDMDTNFDYYIMEMMGIRPSTDRVEGWLRLSSNNGSTFFSGATDYQHAQPVGNTSINNDSKIRLTNASGVESLSNQANNFMQGYSRIYLPAESNKTHVHTDVSFISANETNARQRLTWSRYNSVAVTNAIRFTLSAGSIAEGKFKFYGGRSR